MRRSLAGLRVASWAFLLSLCFTTTLSAQESILWPPLSTAPQMEPGGEKDVAVIIAIDDYAFLPNVTGAVENANDWENFFRRGLGLDKIYVLSNRDATREAILRFARQAVADAEEDSTLWFLFIGHGAPVQDGADGGIVGMDALQNVESLNARSVTQTELLAILESGPQANTVLAVDACFSGRANDGEALAVGMQPVVPVQVAPIMASTNTVIFSAAQADQYAGPLPGMERPAFSYLLLGALRGWADDGNSGAVSAADALHYVRQQLRGVPNRQQTPQLFGKGEIILTRGVSEPDPVRLFREQQLRSRQAMQICDEGRILVEGSHCCWPGQRFSEETQSCVGAPVSCPQGHDIHGEACLLADTSLPLPEEQARQVAFPEDRAESPSNTRRTLGMALTGTGAATLLGAGATYLSAINLISEMEASGTNQVEGQEVLDRANNRALTAGILGATGVALSGLGLYLWLSTPRQTPLEVGIQPGVEPALSLRMRW